MATISVLNKLDENPIILIDVNGQVEIISSEDEISKAELCQRLKCDYVQQLPINKDNPQKAIVIPNDIVSESDGVASDILVWFSRKYTEDGYLDKNPLKTVKAIVCEKKKLPPDMQRELNR
jgi:hypothetical protein